MMPFDCMYFASFLKVSYMRELRLGRLKII